MTGNSRRARDEGDATLRWIAQGIRQSTRAAETAVDSARVAVGAPECYPIFVAPPELPDVDKPD